VPCQTLVLIVFSACSFLFANSSEKASKLNQTYFLADLGKDYCTGYTDVDGTWNTGFYCPQYGSKTAVFCCGTEVFKYCCTDHNPVETTSSDSPVVLDGEDPTFEDDGGVSSAVFVR